MSRALASADELQDIADRGVRPALKLVSAASFAERPAPERAWIVRELIPDRNVTDLSGDGGLGKSLIALQLGIAMATGTDWLGHMPAPGRVLYLSCEDELDEIHRRVAIIADRKGIPLDDLGGFGVIDLTDAEATELAAPDGKQRLALTTLYDAVADVISEHRPKLIVLDTRADVFGGDEISRAQVRFFVRALRRLCFRYDMAILMLSHPSVAGMSSGSGQSGSTAWGNSVRSRLYLERPKADDGSEPDRDLRVLTTKKTNYGPADTTIALRWDAGIFRPDHVGAGTLDRIARDQHIEERFIELLRDFETQGRHVNANAGPYYAPKEFAAADATIGAQQFKAAMRRLFDAKRIKIEAFGAPSRGLKKIVEVAP
jgi:RecA-family ATPase